jgi:hypothetical protein
MFFCEFLAYKFLNIHSPYHQQFEREAGDTAFREVGNGTEGIGRAAQKHETF